MEQSGSKIAIRNIKQFLQSRQSINDAMQNTDKKSLLARTIQKENPIKTDMDLIADTILHIRKVFKNDKQQ